MFGALWIQANSINPRNLVIAAIFWRDLLFQMLNELGQAKGCRKIMNTAKDVDKLRCRRVVKMLVKIGEHSMKPKHLILQLDILGEHSMNNFLVRD